MQNGRIITKTCLPGFIIILRFFRTLKLFLFVIYELTRVEGDFADHNPLGRKAELQFDEAADAVVQLDGNVARSFKDSILDVRVGDGLARKVLAADAEEHLGLGKDLQHAQHHENSPSDIPLRFYIYLKSLL